MLKSIIISKTVEFEELNREAEGVQDPEEAAKVIEKYECIIKTKKKGIRCIACHQGKVFKEFKDREKRLLFLNYAKELEIVQIFYRLGIF